MASPQSAARLRAEHHRSGTAQPAEFTIGGFGRMGRASASRRRSRILDCRTGSRTQINPGTRQDRPLTQMLLDEALQYGGDVDAALERSSRRSNIVRLGEPEDVARLAACSWCLRNRAICTAPDRSRWRMDEDNFAAKLYSGGFADLGPAWPRPRFSDKLAHQLGEK